MAKGYHPVDRDQVAAGRSSGAPGDRGGGGSPEYVGVSCRAPDGGPTGCSPSDRTSMRQRVQRVTAGSRSVRDRPRCHIAGRLTLLSLCKLTCWSRMAGSSLLTYCRWSWMRGITCRTLTVALLVTGLICRRREDGTYLSS